MHFWAVSKLSHADIERFTNAKLLQTEVAKRVCRYTNITFKDLPSPKSMFSSSEMSDLDYTDLYCICTKFVTRNVFSHSPSEGGENENVRLKRTLGEVDLSSQTWQPVAV